MFHPILDQTNIYIISTTIFVSTNVSVSTGRVQPVQLTGRVQATGEPEDAQGSAGQETRAGVLRVCHGELSLLGVGPPGLLHVAGHP